MNNRDSLKAWIRSRAKDSADARYAGELVREVIIEQARELVLTTLRNIRLPWPDGPKPPR